ncbi:MAG: hypothetical protein IJQ20_06450 [Paludibacteraceae bacterium]|nr:hypothetical protein [Paludibacteraceae bacterium]
MAKIDKQTEQRILGAAKVADVLRDRGVELTPRGRQLLGLCPFHTDTRLGSFVVNERGNYYKCFSCGESGDAVKALMNIEGMKYPEALRYLAAMYGIWIDDEPAPKVQKREPRKPLPPTKMMYWRLELLKQYLHHTEENNLLKWMMNLPMTDEHKANLRRMIEIYCVGTSLKGATAGWTMFPQIDMDLRVRDVKFMAYRPDGHRDKSLHYSFNWMHSMMEKAGKFNPDTHHVDHCLFGLHLAKVFPTAEVCLVESEKSALICSAFTNPNERIWMATGGKSGLNPNAILPLVEANRYIVLYPDFDGYDEWTERADTLDYQRLSVSRKVKQLHIAADGDKCDIADIMVRLTHGIEETEVEKAHRLLGLDENHEGLTYLMQSLDLKVED